MKIPEPRNQPMRRAVVLILCLCFLTSTTRPGFSEKPLRLYFEKNIVAEEKSEDQYQHTVQDNEWLFKILTSKGYTAAEIGKLMPLIQAMNPHIPDVNQLRPGQVLHLPEPAKAMHIATTNVRSSHNEYSVVPYTIQSGDTLAQILQNHGVPTNLIFGQFMDLFLTLNPQIPNTDTLRVGQEVTLPVPKATAPERPSILPAPSPLDEDSGNRTTQNASGAITGNGHVGPGQPGAGFGPSDVGSGVGREHTSFPSPGSPLPVTSSSPQVVSLNATQSEPKPERVPRTGLPLIRTILEQMRFSFAPGDESIYPVANGEWLHVKMHETPLIYTPWGEKVLLCPVPKNEQWISNAKSLGMQVCAVSSRWSIQDVLDKLSNTFPEYLRLWEPGRELVLSRGDISFTLQAPQILIVDNRGQKNVYVVWRRPNPESHPLPQGLPEVFEQANVKVIEMDSYNELSRLPTRPRESVFVPVATHMDVIRAMNPDKPEEIFGPALPDSLSSLFQTLKAKDLLRQGRIHVGWSAGPQRRLSLQVPAWSIATDQAKIALLDRRFAEEYLVSLLSHEGYTCFILPD